MHSRRRWTHYARKMSTTLHVRQLSHDACYSFCTQNRPPLPTPQKLASVDVGIVGGKYVVGRSLTWHWHWYWHQRQGTELVAEDSKADKRCVTCTVNLTLPCDLMAYVWSSLDLLGAKYQESVCGTEPVALCSIWKSDCRPNTHAVDVNDATSFSRQCSSECLPAFGTKEVFVISSGANQRLKHTIYWCRQLQA